jgi:hypothetical protein
MSETELSAKKIPELKALCKEQSLPVSGTKAELIARLLGTAPPAKKAKTAKPPKPKDFEKPVFDKWKTPGEREPILIKRNMFGHFEHPETRLLFSAQKKVIGVQVDANPDPQPLTAKHLELVHKYHFELAESVIVTDPVAVNHNNDVARVEELYERLVVPESK